MLNKAIHFATESLAAHWHLIFTVCLVTLLLTGFLALRQMNRGGRPKPGGKSGKRSGSKDNTAASSLRRLPSGVYQVFQELHIPRLDGKGVTRISYVVVARHGIFVIHPQREVGLISGGPGDRNWICQDGGQEAVFTNPVIRNAYHARSLARHLGLPEALICPVVLFDQEVTFAHKPPPNVLTSGLRSFILSHQAELLSGDMLAGVLKKLREAAANTEARDEYESYRRTKSRRQRRPSANGN